MVYELPVEGELDWHIKLNASVDTVKATADAAETPTGALSKVDAHAGAPDPHGDRAYADGRFSPLEHTHERLPLLAANSRTTTSAPGGFPEGRTVMVATSASGTWPGSGDGFLFSTINGTYPAMQEFLDLTTPPRLFVRRWATGTSTWSVWGEK